MKQSIFNNEDGLPRRKERSSQMTKVRSRFGNIFLAANLQIMNGNLEKPDEWNQAVIRVYNHAWKKLT